MKSIFDRRNTAIMHLLLSHVSPNEELDSCTEEKLSGGTLMLDKKKKQPTDFYNILDCCKVDQE